MQGDEAGFINLGDKRGIYADKFFKIFDTFFCGVKDFVKFFFLQGPQNAGFEDKSSFSSVEPIQFYFPRLKEDLEVF